MTTKEGLRSEVWDALQREGVDRFPGAEGRIPNFIGAEAAATRLAEWESWRRAEVLKANPDSPQRPVRERALREGKRVYMAVPRLRERKCFIEVDPGTMREDQLHRASTIRGSSALGRAVMIKEMPPIDLVIAGSVAVDREGGRIGKGGGYSDLEYALAGEAGLLTPETPIATTVHDLQVLPAPLPQEEHDLRLSLIVTPTETIVIGDAAAPASILWELLSDEQIESMPVLAERREARSGSGGGHG